LLQLHALGAHGLGLGLLNCYPSAGDNRGGFGSDGYNTGYNSISNGQGSSVGELVAQLLRVAGHSSNPLDCSTAWQLLGVLQAVGALPSRRQECESFFVSYCVEIFVLRYLWYKRCLVYGLLSCLAAAWRAAGGWSPTKQAAGM
jgi:hypothetical protein